jgi:hypothetical protein
MGEHDARTGARQAASGRGPYAAARSGDERDRSVESSHRRILFG